MRPPRRASTPKRYSRLAALLLLALLHSPEARAHPGGIPPLAEIVPAGSVARTALTLALDDTILLLAQAGAPVTDPGRLGPDALAAQPGVAEYLTSRYAIAVPEGECSASVAGARDVDYGLRFLLDHSCPAPIGDRLTVRTGLLRDVSPDYRLAVAVTVGGRAVASTIEPPLSEAALDLTGAASPTGEVTDGRRGTRNERGLASLFSFLDAGRGPGAALVALGIAAALGALHGLGPGHGKTLVAAYVAGSHARLRDAFGVGIALTVTHTAAVIALGLVALALGEALVPRRVEPILSAVAAGIVLVLGLTLLVRRGLALRRGVEEHAPGHDHDHDHDHGHAAREGERAAGGGRGLLAIGLAGGIVPCPEAFGLLFVALTLGRVAAGLLLLLAFSVGLAAVLVGVSVVLVLSRSAMSSRLERWRLVRYLPVISASLVTAVGVVLAVAAARKF